MIGNKIEYKSYFKSIFSSEKMNDYKSIAMANNLRGKYKSGLLEDGIKIEQSNDLVNKIYGMLYRNNDFSSITKIEIDIEYYEDEMSIGIRISE